MSSAAAIALSGLSCTFICNSSGRRGSEHQYAAWVELLHLAHYHLKVALRLQIPRTMGRAVVFDALAAQGKRGRRRTFERLLVAGDHAGHQGWLHVHIALRRCEAKI